MARPFEFREPRVLHEQTGDAFADLVRLMRRLLAPDGCPWDRKQTPQSLCRYVVEEASELVDALEADNAEAVCEELGDLALQIAFVSELYRERGTFGPDDAMAGIVEKLVRRHPHVFAAEDAPTPEAVEANWDRIKLQEKRLRPLLDGVARNLPALLRATRQGEQAAKVGFDWQDAAGCRAKVEEELAELDQAIEQGEAEKAKEEYGDLLLALVRWGRHLDFDPETALRDACDKFQRRFAEVERRVLDTHGDWPRDERGRPTRGLSLEELDRYWNEAKDGERRER